MPVSVQGDCASVTVDVTQAIGIKPLSMLCMQSHGHMCQQHGVQQESTAFLTASLPVHGAPQTIMIKGRLS